MRISDRHQYTAHAEFRPNDNGEDTSHFIHMIWSIQSSRPYAMDSVTGWKSEKIDNFALD